MVLNTTKLPVGFINILKANSEQVRLVDQGIAHRPDKLFSNSVNDSIDLELVHNTINGVSPITFVPNLHYSVITQKLFSLLEML